MKAREVVSGRERIKVGREEPEGDTDPAASTTAQRWPRGSCSAALCVSPGDMYRATVTLDLNQHRLSLVS